MRKLIVLIALITSVYSFGQRQIETNKFVFKGNNITNFADTIFQSGDTLFINWAIGDYDTIIFAGAGDTSLFARVGNYTYLKTSTDSLGLGTTSPDEKLEIAGNLQFDDGATRFIKVATSPTTQGNHLVIRSGEGTFDVTDASGNIYIYTPNDDTDGNILLNVNENGTKMGGYVGIGVAVPGHPLDVDGTIRGTGELILTGISQRDSAQYVLATDGDTTVQVTFPVLNDSLKAAEYASPSVYTPWLRDTTNNILKPANINDNVLIGDTAKTYFSNTYTGVTYLNNVTPVIPVSYGDVSALFVQNDVLVFSSTTGIDLSRVISSDGAYVPGVGTVFAISTSISSDYDEVKEYYTSSFDSTTLTVVGNIYSDNLKSNYFTGMMGAGVGIGGDTLSRASLFGIKAGFLSSGEQNTFIGYSSGAETNADAVTGVGYYSAWLNESNELTAIGYISGQRNLGTQVTAIGSNSGTDNTGNQCSFVGWQSGWFNTGDYNLGFGSGASESNTGDSNIFIGINSGYYGTSNYCVGLGFQALRENDADNVIAIGYEAGKDNTTDNLFIVKQSNLNATPIIQGNLLTNMLTFQDVTIADSLAVTGNATFGDNITVENTATFNSVVFLTNIEHPAADSVIIDDNLHVNGGITMTDPDNWMDQFRKSPFYNTEFFWHYASMNPPWFGAAVSSGTASDVAKYSASHPGQVRLAPSTTSNSGWYWMTGPFDINGLTGGEMTTCVINYLKLDSVTTRFGFHDALTVTAPVDGAYFEIGPDSVCYGKTMVDSTGSTTATGYTMTTDVWYRLKLVVNADATRVDFYIYNESGGVLWTENLTTNIPGTNTYTGHGIIMTQERTGTGTSLVLILDYMDVYLGTLIR